MEKEQSLPACIGFIMDGNRRWAKKNLLESLEGHKKGSEVFHTMVRTLRDRGIKHGVFYAFSTENWNRSEREVNYLMELLKNEVKELLKGVDEEKVGIRFIGERARLSEELQRLIAELEEKSSAYTSTTIWIAFSYGGRAEIIEAVNKAVERGGKVSEESFGDLLWTKGMPDPDIIIRTGGEERLSNFLTWQSVYSELFFTDTYWPDFGKEEFERILEEYGNRQRRRGK